MSWNTDSQSSNDTRAASSNESHFVDYLRLLSKRRWTATTVFSLVMIGVLWTTFTATPIYESSAQLLIENDNQNVITFKEVVEQERTTAEYYQTQYKILQSRALAKATIQKLNLWDNPEFGTGMATAAKPPSRLRRMIDPVISAASRVLRPLLGRPEPSPVADVPEAVETAAQSRVIYSFLQRLTVSPVRNSRLVDVRFRSTDPARAAAVANALAQAYIDRSLEFKFLATKEASDWLANQLAEQRKRVDQTEAALQQYRERQGALSTDEPQLTQKLAELNSAVTKAKTSRIEKETVYQQLEQVRKNQHLDASPLVLGNSTIQSLRGRLADLERDLGARGQKLGDRHPEILKLRADVAAVQAQLRGEVDNVFNATKNDYLTAKLQEEQLLEAVNIVKADLIRMNRTGTEYRRLDGDVASNRQIFDVLLQRAKETDISSELRPNNIRIADEASLPRSPVWPRTQRNLLFGLLAGLVLAVGLAFVAEYLDDKLKSPEEIRSVLRIPCLGIVPKVKARGGKRVLLSNDVPPLFAESFRAVRTNVLFAADQRRTLLVTSSRPGEGKSLIASNLAVGLALAGQRVLIVDADMRRPQVHTILDVEQKPGLSEMLAGLKASETIRSSLIPGLWVLPAGAVVPNPAELLSSNRLAKFLAAASAQFDWLIVDSPPVLAVTDASLLAHACSAVVFVVASEKTDRATALKALEQLDGAKAQFLGAVLNQVDLARNAFFYAPYYRSDYTKYYASRAS